MSRIGKQPVVVPKGVNVSIANEVVTVKGPKGQLQVNLLPGVSAAVEDGSINVLRIGSITVPRVGCVMCCGLPSRRYLC